MDAEISFSRQSVIYGPNGEPIMRVQQAVSEDELTRLRDTKNDNDESRCKDLFKVGEVPDWLFNKWLYEDGYDARLAPVAETLKRLRAEAAVYALTDRRI